MEDPLIRRAASGKVTLEGGERYSSTAEPSLFTPPSSPLRDVTAIITSLEPGLGFPPVWYIAFVWRRD